MKTRFAVDTIALTFVKLTTALIGLICVRIISDQFSLSEYGTYSQATLLVSTVSSLTILGLTDAANYFFNKYYEDKNGQLKYISTLLLLQLFISVCCIFLLLLFSTQISHFFQNNDLISLYPVIVFMPLCANLISILQVLFISVGRAKLIAWRNLLVSILKLTTFVLGCYVFKSVFFILLLTLLTDIGQILYFYFLLKKDGYTFKLRFFESNYIKPILSIGLPMSLYILCSSLMRDCDKYIVSYFTNTETLAIYTNASKILPFDMLTVSFSTVLLPFITKNLANDNKEKALIYISKYINFSFITTWILIIGAILCAKEIMLLLYGEKYLVGLSIFIVYLLVTMIRFANLTIIFSAVGKTRIIMTLSLFLLISNMIFSVLLYYAIGIIGCAIATLIVSLLGNYYICYRAKEVLGSSLYASLDLRFYLHLCLFTIPVFLFIYLIKYFFIDRYFPGIFSLCLSYGSFIVILSLYSKNKLISNIKNID